MTQKKISAYAIPGLKNRYQDIPEKDFDLLVNLVAKHYGISVDQILGKNRTVPLPYIRMLIIHYIRRNYSLTSTTQIGKLMKRKDHTTAIYGTNRFQDKLDANHAIDKELKSKYATVREDYLHTSKYLNSCL